MIAILLPLASLALWGSIATVAVTAQDGHRRIPTDPMLVP